MSGEAPLRYESPLNWPLVPPLADDDDDSVELPSTVDVNAIWDLPQPGDGSTRLAPPATASSTQLSSPTAEPAAPSSPHTEPRPPQLPPLLPPHSPHSPPPSSSLKPSRSATPSPPPPQSPAQSKSLDMPTPMPLPPPTSMSAVAISLASSPPSPPLRASPQLLLPPPPPSLPPHPRPRPLSPTTRRSRTSAKAPQQPSPTLTSSLPSPPSPPSLPASPPPPSPPSSPTVASSSSAAATSRSLPPPRTASPLPPPPRIAPSSQSPSLPSVTPPPTSPAPRRLSSSPRTENPTIKTPPAPLNPKSSPSALTTAAAKGAVAVTTTLPFPLRPRPLPSEPSTPEPYQSRQRPRPRTRPRLRPPPPPPQPPPPLPAAVAAAAAAVSASTTTPGTPSPSPAPPTPLSSSPTPRTETPATMQQPPRLAPPALPPSSSRSPHPKPHQSQPRPPPPTATAADAVTPLPRFPLTSISKQLVPQPPSKYLLSPSTPLAAFPRRSSPQRSSASFRSSRQASRSPRPASPSSPPGTASAATAPPVSRSLLSRAATPSTGSGRRSALAVGKHVHSSSDGDESDIDSDSWSSGSGGRDSDSDSGGWSEKSDSATRDGAAALPAQRTRESPQSSVAESRRSPAAGGQGSAPAAPPAARRRTACADSSSSAAAPVGRLAGGSQRTEPSPVRSPRLSGDRRQYSRPRPRPRPQPAEDPQQTSGAPPAARTRTPTGETGRHNQHLPTRTTADTVSPKGEKTSPQNSQLRSQEARNVTVSFPTPCSKANDGMSLSGSDDSEFDVGGVRAAIQSLDDDAETAERVTTPEKQTWWKNKLKHSAMGRAESAHGLVRPWETRREAGKANARHSSGQQSTTKAPTRPAAATDNGPRVGRSEGEKQRRVSVRLSESSEDEEEDSSPVDVDKRCDKIGGGVSPQCAMPVVADSHVRKPSLSVILNLENKNSLLRGACPMRGDNYEGAPKLPHQLRSPDVRPPLSRPRGRLKPSESAPPPRAAELMAPPSSVPAAASEPCDSPASCNALTLPGNRDEGGREGGQRPLDSVGPEARTSRAGETMADVQESAGDGSVTSQSPQWPDERGSLTAGGMSPADPQQRQPLAEFFHSPRSYHGSPASLSSFSSAATMITDATASDVGATVSVAPNPFNPKADAADSETGDSTQRGVQSIILSRRRRLKLLKRKHKNIVDPVLLADVEEVVQRVSSLMIGRGASRQSDHSANARTATCFQTRKYGRKRKVPLEKIVRTDREMADEHDKKTGKDPPPCTQEDENKEHCLPLKKRYHHISQALAESINCVAKPPSQTATTGLCKGEQSMKDGCLAPRAKEAVDEKVKKVQDAKSLEASGTAPPDRVSSIGKPVISKEYVRSRSVESPAKSVATVNQSKPSLNESEGASQKPSLVTSQTEKDDASNKRRPAVSRPKSPVAESIKQTAKNRISDAREESQGLALNERTKPVLPTKRKPATCDEPPVPVNHKVVDTDDAVAEVKDAARSPRKLNGGQPRRGVGSIRPLSGSGLEGRRQLRKPASSTEPPGDPSRRRHRRRRRRHRSISDRPSSEESVTSNSIVAPLADTLDPPVPAPTPGDTITTENPPSIHEAASDAAPAIGQTATVPAADPIQPAKLASLPVSSEASPAPPAQEETEDRTTRPPAKPSPDATGLTVQKRKRRKINRTGFPNKKKKVRPKSRQPTPEPATPTPGATPTPEVVAESPKSSAIPPDADQSKSEPASASTEKPDPDEGKSLPGVKPQPEMVTQPVDSAVTQPAPKSDVPSGRVSRELRGLRRPERPSPSAQLQQTAVVRLDKMGELPARHPAGTIPPKQRDHVTTAAATDVDSETAPTRDESAEPAESPARPAVRPTSRRPTDRKRKKPPAAVAPSKRTRVDRTDEFLMEDDIFFESDLVISESGPSSEVPSGDELHRPTVTSSTTRIAAPKWKKKKYLTAGLFSDYYKVDRESDRQELTKSRLSYEPADHEHGLLPPPCYEEKWLRQRPRDFTLPYDLWWLQANGQLPGRDTVASWNYKKLRTNYYFDVKPPPLREVEACSCRPPLDPQRPGCGEDCINRMMFVECSSSSCPCGDRCDNQRIQRHRWAPGLVKFMTGEKGWGIMTRRQIRSGTFILEYVGEIVSDKEFKRRMQTRYINDQHHYCLNLDRGLVIDGHRMGSIGRFVNHSCSPNCEMQKWEMNGLSRMALFSKQDIPAGTELTYDYNFALFNPAVGQKCHCGASECRGVIGGRSQRVGPPPQQVERCRGRAAITAATSSSAGTTSTASAASTSSANGAGAGSAQPPVGNGAGGGESGATRQERNSSAGSEQAGGELAARDAVTLPVRPLSARDVRFIRLHSSFLVRNYEKMRRQREPPLEAARPASPAPAGAQEETFRAQLRALDSSRSVRTRRLAAAEEDPQMVRTLKLAHILKEIYQAVVASPGEGPGPSAIEALTLPRKPRVPSGCVSDAPASLLPEPLDISDIERHIVTGQYKTADAFDHDFRRLFTAQLRAHGRCSPVGAAVLRLKHKYAEFKTVMMSQIQEILGVVPSSFRPPAKRRQDTGLDGEEDTIRCVCNLHREEGLMIQCERCLVWQHCDCVDADPAIEKYACELCEPRHISPEVQLKPQPEDAEPDLTYYLSLMRDQLQVRQGDCVYIMQGDMVKAAQEAGKVPYTFVKRLVPDELLIFRVEKLWKDESGGRFAFGYHYCRPQETYHEPTRKFYTKEVMRSPLYEVVPLELVVGTCWVLDVNTYCKGRPVGANENSVYVCEYRVDKTARLFAKLTKNRHPICTKAFAFDSFETRLKISRTFTPHAEEVAQKLKPEKAKAKKEEASAAPAAPKVVKPKVPKETSKHAPPPPKIETPGEKARRLDGVLLRLLARMPGPPLDVSHLLDSGKRHRRRPGARL